MKKFLFILVMSLIFGMNVNANDVKLIDNVRIENVDKYNLSIDSVKISHSIKRYLKLEDNQQMFYQIHKNVYDYIQLLENKHELVAKEFNMNLKHNLRLSKLILDDEQYKKYLLVINQTLNNNDLTKYITKE